ncbi:MAG TPA: hypothetical protein VFC51_12245 [Chloroflexota bacterium]|nr:hypothetical protein [Chloroflexota bacterium]
MIRHFALVAILLAATARGSDAFVMCNRVNAQGIVRDGAAIRVRTACKASEVALNPSDLDLPPSPPPKHAILKDSHGTVMGVVSTQDPVPWRPS